MLVDTEAVTVESRRRQRAMLPIVLLLFALAPGLWLLLSNLDLPLFGIYQDDGLLLINAKSLSEGRGFRILSLPGEPHQTKYQPLLPLLQSALWGANPRFPSILPAIGLLQTAAFVAFVLLAAAFFRRAKFSPIESAGLAAFLACSPLVIYWAAVPTADYLFAALVIATFLATGQQQWLLAGALTAAAYLAKSAGVLIVPAVLAALMLQRNWSGLRQYLLPAVPVIGGWMLWTAGHKAAEGHAVLSYYTDYAGYLVRSGGLAAMADIIPANAVSLCTAAGSLVVHDLADSLPGRFLSILVAAATVTGGVRFARRTGAVEYPIFCALLAAVLCLWNFSPSARLILPLGPLVAIGVYLEGQNFRVLARKALQDGGANRAVAWLLIALVTLGGVYAIQHNASFISQTIPGVMAQNRTKARETATIHGWMAQHLPPSSVVMASEDTLLYLRTGLRSVRPVPNSVAFYRQDRAGMLENFAHPESLEQAFGITHLLIGPTDLSTDFDLADQREAVRLLRQNPRHRLLYEDSGYSILTVADR